MIEEHRRQRRFFLYTTQTILAPRDVTHIRVDLEVEKLQRSAFQNRNALVEVILPEGLKVIGEEVFRYCRKIKHISIPSTVPVLSYGMLLCCNSLVSVQLLEGLREVGNLAFSGCTSLKSIRIPSTTETIGISAFSYCISLTNVSLQEGLLAINEGAFEHCAKLSWMNIPSTVQSIREGTFLACGSLTNVKLNEGLEYIGPRVFAGCSSMLSVAIPPTTKAIGFGAFQNCSNLLGVEISDDRILELDHEIFRGCTNLINVSISSTVSAEDLFVECPLLHKKQLDQAALLKRYEKLPIHEACYHASRTILDDLKARLKMSNVDSCVVDAFGMSPLHVIATSADIRQDLLELLLEHYSLDIISHKDIRGKTILDYLLMQNTSMASHRVKIVLKFAALKMVSGWGLARWKLKNLFKHGRPPLRGSHDWRHRIRKILTKLLPYLQAELTSTLELVLWKMKIKEAEDLDGCKNRESCRVICKAEDVISNVVDFLWTGCDSTLAPQEFLPQAYCLISMDGGI